MLCSLVTEHLTVGQYAVCFFVDIDADKCIQRADYFECKKKKLVHVSKN